MTVCRATDDGPPWRKHGWLPRARAAARRRVVDDDSRISPVRDRAAGGTPYKLNVHERRVCVYALARLRPLFERFDFVSHMITGYMASSPLMTKRNMTALTPGHIREVITGMHVGGFRLPSLATPAACQSHRRACRR